MAAEFFVGQKIKCMEKNYWYGAKIKKVEPERVLVQWSNPKWQSSKYDEWIMKAYYNMRIKVLSVDNYFSGNSNEEVSSRMKHINNWTYKELHEWICSLNGVSVRNQKKIVDTICRDKICGRDFNSSIEDMSDIRDGFPDISDNGVKNIYVGLQLLRQKINVESVVDLQASVKSFNPLKEKKLIPKINQLTYTRASVNIKSVKTWDNNDFLRWIKVLQDIGCFQGNDADTMNYIITQNQYSGKDLYNCNTQNFIMKLFKGRIKKTTAKILKESLFLERQMYIKRQQSKLQIEQGLWQPFLQEKIRVIDYRCKKPYRSYRATIKKVFDNKIFVSYDGYTDQQGEYLKTDQWDKKITIINIKSKQPIQNKKKIKKIQNGYTPIQNIYTPIQNKNKKKIQNRYKPTQNTYKPTQIKYKQTQNDPTQSYVVGYDQEKKQEKRKRFDRRQKWKKGDEVEVFSRSYGGWLAGTIIDVTDINEYLKIKYTDPNGEIRNKSVKRFDMKLVRDKEDNPEYSTIKNIAKNTETLKQHQQKILYLEQKQEEIIQQLAKQRLEFEQQIDVSTENTIQNDLNNLYRSNDVGMILFYDIFAKKCITLFYDAKAVQSKYINHKVVYKNKALSFLSKGTKIISKFAKDIPFVSTALDAFNGIMEAGYDALVLQQAADNTSAFELLMDNSNYFARRFALGMTYYLAKDIKKINKNKLNGHVKKLVNNHFDYLAKLISTGYAKEIFIRLSQDKNNIKDITKVYWNVLFFLVLKQPTKSNVLVRKSFVDAWKEINCAEFSIEIALNLKDLVKEICDHFQSDKFKEILKRSIRNLINR